MVGYVIYTMIAFGTWIAMFTSEREFNFVNMIMNTLFWPMFWGGMICAKLMKG